MFKKLFKTETKPAPTVTIMERRLKPVTSKEIQDEMHAELRFVLDNNQIEVITNEVTEFKAQNRNILTKAERLKSLGFVNTPTINVEKELKKQIKAKENQVKLEKAEIDFTNKYLLEFPGYKFVPERIYNNVKEKYNLYTSETDRYIKEIPEKNLSEIENFIPLIKDSYELTYERNSDWSNSRRSRYITGTEEDLKDRMKWLDDPKRLEGMSPELRRHSGYYNMRVGMRSDLLEITAPIDHFNLKDSEVEGRTIKNKRPVEDPIVTHKVHGGYIIVSVWDKEAEIPEIQNPMNN